MKVRTQVAPFFVVAMWSAVLMTAVHGQQGSQVPPQGQQQQNFQQQAPPASAGQGVQNPQQQQVPVQVNQQMPPQGQPQMNQQMPPQGQPQMNQMPPQGQPQMNQQMPPQMNQQMPPQGMQQMPPQGQPQMNQMPPQGMQQMPPQGMQQMNQMPPQGMQQMHQMPPQGQPPQMIQMPPQGMQQMPPQVNLQMQPQMHQQMPPQMHQQMPPQGQVPPQLFNQQPRQPHMQGGGPPSQGQQGRPIPQGQQQQQPKKVPMAPPIVVEPGYAQGPAARIMENYDYSSKEVGAAPGVAMEYKVHVEAGKEDCYWQYTYSGATLYVAAQVLKGGDGNIGLGIRHPNGKVLLPYAWKTSSEFEEKSAQQGYYAICLDNQFSKFSAKLVNLYITTFRYDEWEKFASDLQTLDVSAANMTETLGTVERRIQAMKQLQQLSRSQEARDFNLLLGNLFYVNAWSITQVVVIAVCGFVQVFFVRKLFDSGPKGKSKTRA